MKKKKDIELLVKHSPARFILKNEGNDQVPRVSIVNLGPPLVNPTINGRRIFKKMLSGSVVSVSPDGKGVYTYTDNFLRYYKWREQELDARGVENLKSASPSQPKPKVLDDLYRFQGRDLFFNNQQDGLWWTGEITYKFESIGAFKSFQLGDPDPRKPTIIRDWEGLKGGRAVRVFASNDAQKWQMIRHSAQSTPPQLGKYQVCTHGSRLNVLLPSKLLNKKVIYIKFQGECQNLLSHLFIQAEFDASRVKLPVIGSGRNELIYTSGSPSPHQAVVVLDGLRESELVRPRPKVILPQKDIFRPEVTIGHSYIRIDFPNNASIRIAKNGEIIKGIDSITSQGQVILKRDALHNDLGLRIKTIKEGKVSPIQYTRCIYRGCTKDKDTVIVRTLLKGKSQEDKLDWIFSSRKVRIKEEDYIGIGYSFRFRSKVNKAVEIEVKEPVAKKNARVIQQSWGDFMEEEPSFADGEYYRGRELDGFFVGMQPFFFQAGKDGAFLSYFDSILFTRQAILGYAGRLSLKYDIPVKYANQFTTPGKYWLVNPKSFGKRWDAVRQWTKVYDYFYRKFRESRGIEEITPQPIIWSESARSEYQQIREKGIPRRAWLYRLADYLPRVAGLGIRAIFVNSIWECPLHQPRTLCPESDTSPWQFTVSSLLGGEEGLKHLCKEAHKYEIKIILWMTAADLSASSPLLRDHPDWVSKGPDGEPVCFEWVGALWAMNLYRGYFDYLIKELKGLRRRTGVDGLWQDCFHEFSRARDFSQGKDIPQLERMIALEKQLQKIGYKDILLEGAGPFGLGSGGCVFVHDSHLKWRNREYGLYNYVADIPIENISRRMYYKVLANKGMIALLHHSWQTAKAIAKDRKFYQMLKEKVAQANRDYNHVCGLMEEKNLLGESGVEWANSKNNDIILFSFKSFSYKIRQGFRVIDVTAGRQVKAQTEKKFCTRPLHTYRITDTEHRKNNRCQE